MKLHLSEGRSVIYNNALDTTYHGMAFTVEQFVPVKMNKYGMVTDWGGFKITNQLTSMVVQADMLVSEEDPSQSKIMSVEDLAILEEGIKDDPPKVKRSHEGHNIGVNYAGGYPFSFCKDCKVEIDE